MRGFTKILELGMCALCAFLMMLWRNFDSVKCVGVGCKDNDALLQVSALASWVLWRCTAPGLLWGIRLRLALWVRPSQTGVPLVHSRLWFSVELLAAAQKRLKGSCDSQGKGKLTPGDSGQREVLLWAH